MTDGREVVLRRTWPQRLVAVACLAVIVSAVALADLAEHVEEVWSEVDRVVIIDTGQYGDLLLRTDTEPGEPVNFLIVGTDSALGLDPDDPVMSGRVVDPTGRSLADTIMLVRLDPVSGSAWVLSIPRDLWAEIPGAQDNRITSALYIGGAELLVATVTSMFDVEINHYIEVNLAGFREVVEALGGVPVWFENPVRDTRLGFSISEPGCHVLNGERALHYVRSRRYTEQIDGRWRITGGDDFSRIERQQDFLVLALDRAINRGARNPSTMVELLDAAAGSLTLDQDLTLAELIALGEAFADFNPENLQRQRLEVYTVWWPDGIYKGEAAYKGANEPLLEVFRGLADSVRPSEVSLTIAGFHDIYRDDAATMLAGEGFDVLGSVASSRHPRDRGAARPRRPGRGHDPGPVPRSRALRRRGRASRRRGGGAGLRLWRGSLRVPGARGRGARPGAGPWPAGGVARPGLRVRAGGDRCRRRARAGRGGWRRLPVAGSGRCEQCRRRAGRADVGP